MIKYSFKLIINIDSESFIYDAISILEEVNEPRSSTYIIRNWFI